MLHCAISDLAISIQVGIEAGSPLAIGGHVHEGRDVGVVLGEEDIKQEAAPMIGCPFWTCANMMCVSATTSGWSTCSNTMDTARQYVNHAFK